MATTILFERNSGVYLPEISAYCDFLKHATQDVIGLDSATFPPGWEHNHYDVHWRFMGMDSKGLKSLPHSEIVHEYGSLSVPPFARLKNRLKRALNVSPVQRVFLNEQVQNEMGFNDSVPAFLRDMGIDERFFAPPAHNAPDYDFVYCGSLYRGQTVLGFLEKFSQRTDLGRLLVIGEVRPEDSRRLQSKGHIVFTGRLPYAEVPAMVCRARFALNLMPDIYPFNIQTSTKLLEYCALGMPIITTDYRWIKRVEATRQARFFKLPSDLDALTRSELDSFAFVTPDVKDLEWSHILQNSGLFNKWLHA